MFDLDLIISQPQEAVFWFIPIIVGAAIVGAGTGALVGVIIDALCPIEGKTIAVLGMQGAGKTQFLANLKNVSYKQSASLGVESYKAFTVKIGDKTVKIEGGMDVPGGEEYIRRYYEDLISKNDIVFFLFNTYNFLTEEEYNLKTKARLDFIHEKVDGTKKNVVVIGTFADMYKDEKEASNARKQIFSSVINKPYGSLLKNNFVVLDMRDGKRLKEEFLYKIFV